MRRRIGKLLRNIAWIVEGRRVLEVSVVPSKTFTSTSSTANVQYTITDSTGTQWWRP